MFKTIGMHMSSLPSMKFGMKISKQLWMYQIYRSLQLARIFFNSQYGHLLDASISLRKILNFVYLLDIGQYITIKSDKIYNEYPYWGRLNRHKWSNCGCECICGRCHSIYCRFYRAPPSLETIFKYSFVSSLTTWPGIPLSITNPRDISTINNEISLDKIKKTHSTKLLLLSQKNKLFHQNNKLKVTSRHKNLSSKWKGKHR